MYQVSLVASRVAAMLTDSCAASMHHTMQVVVDGHHTNSWHVLLLLEQHHHTDDRSHSGHHIDWQDFMYVCKQRTHELRLTLVVGYCVQCHLVARHAPTVHRLCNVTDRIGFQRVYMIGSHFD
jgi:hypothetical protein